MATKNIFTKICSSALITFALLIPQSVFAQIEAVTPQNANSQQLTQNESATGAPTPEEFQELPPELLIPSEFLLGEIKSIEKQGVDEEMGTPMPYQILKVELINGKNKGRIVQINHGSNVSIRETDKVEIGQSVVLAQVDTVKGSTYYIYDKYRLPPTLLVAVIFFALVILMAGKKGFWSIIGLVVSVMVLYYFIVPGIISGQNPLLISTIGALLICVCSMFLAHGFNKQTTLAFISTIITLIAAAIFSIIFVNLTRLTGAGTEEAFYLQFGDLEKLNLQGLLLGGIMIGVLGVLDDITTGQTAAVCEIHKANPKLKFADLYKRGINVGREHIASLVNTLVLAYAGASLPLFLIFHLNNSIPLWVNLNSEFIIEEIIRTLVGSTALVLAVPIATFIAARALTQPRHA
ncbi:YibE/F family protein [Candidatus Peregrinibacteria bacterium]|nr:YibE/F family protein [Candidatus Peregrinibacteria bacterium]